MSKGSRSRWLRELAESKLASKVPPDFESLTVDEVRRLVHELEVHQVELEIQNEQLRESQLAAEEAMKRYEQLYESAPIGYFTIDSRGVVVATNPAAVSLLRAPSSRVIGRKFSRFVAPRHQDRWHLERRALMRGGSRSFELELAPSEEETLQAQVVGFSLGPEQPMLRFAVLDVTELRETERALRIAASEASLAEERERRKLASDLHDDAGQLLSLASLKLRALHDALAGAGAAGIREVEEILAEARRRISSLSFELSPPLLHDVGLVAAARWLADDLERRYGLVVTVSAAEEVALPESAAVALYRAMREILVNVSKHAGVAAAKVEIGQDGGMARVAVEDAGVGFSTEAGSQGFGLLALRERLGLLGGRLSVVSVPGDGTRAVASVPMLSSVGALRVEGGSRS